MSTCVTTPIASGAPWRAGLESARRLTGPGVVLVSAAAMVVTSYYHAPAVRAWLDEVAEFRVRCGWAYGALAQALFAGLIPFLYLHVHPRTRALHPARHGAFFVLFWAYKGLEVDAFYRLQAVLFGDGPELSVVLPKVAVDQLVYNPLFAAPIAVVVYGWKDAGWRWAEPLADLRTPRWYYRRVLPVTIAVWAVWVPAVSCIYALPLALQLPLCSLVNCFWVILFSLMTAPEPAA